MTMTRQQKKTKRQRRRRRRKWSAESIDGRRFLVSGNPDGVFVHRLRRASQVSWFLHTPFPSSEIYRILPVRRELLEGLLCADLLGFHT
jgi:hypothetical protein